MLLAALLSLGLLWLTGCARDIHIAADGTAWYVVEDTDIRVIEASDEAETVKWIRVRAGDTVIRAHLTGESDQ